MRLNPPDDYELKEGDMILCIAEDEESYAPTGVPQQVHFEPLPSKVIEKKAEKARTAPGGGRQGTAGGCCLAARVRAPWSLVAGFSGDAEGWVGWFLHCRPQVLFVGWRRDMADLVQVPPRQPLHTTHPAPHPTRPLAQKSQLAPLTTQKLHNPQHMDEFVPKGSELWIFCDVPEEEREDHFARARCLNTLFRHYFFGF